MDDAPPDCAAVALFFSVGPVAALTVKVPTLDKPAVAFYQPVIWLSNHTALDKPIAAYIEFWVKTAKRI